MYEHSNCHQTRPGTALCYFSFAGGLFQWHVTRREPTATIPRALAIHSSRATSLQRRTSNANLKRPTDITSDAPQSLRHASPSTCAACAEAKSTRLAHTGENYAPSYPGRPVHVDIAGPFQPSIDGGRRYALVIVDDYTRLKAVHIM
eukprot:5083419-Pleurochrysis_carterae.AAC.6